MSEIDRQRSAMRKARELCAAESARVAESSDPDRAAYGRACGKVLLAFLEWMDADIESPCRSGAEHSVQQIAQTLDRLRRQQ